MDHYGVGCNFGSFPAASSNMFIPTTLPAGLLAFQAKMKAQEFSMKAQEEAARADYLMHMAGAQEAARQLEAVRLQQSSMRLDAPTFVPMGPQQQQQQLQPFRPQPQQVQHLQEQVWLQEQQLQELQAQMQQMQPMHEDCLSQEVGYYMDDVGPVPPGPINKSDLNQEVSNQAAQALRQLLEEEKCQIQLPPPGLAPPGLPSPALEQACNYPADAAEQPTASGPTKKSGKKRSTKATDMEPENMTTLMLKNIANQYTIEQIMEDLRVDANLYGVHDYDYLYLPTDFQSHRNKSYGFVNFTSHSKLKEFEEQVQLASQGKKLLKKHKTPKMLEVAPANVQGRDENMLAHLRSQSGTGVTNKWFRPVVLLKSEGEQYLTLASGVVVQLESLWGSVYAVHRICSEPELERPLALDNSNEEDGLHVIEGTTEPATSKMSRKRRGKRGGQRTRSEAPKETISSVHMTCVSGMHSGILEREVAAVDDANANPYQHDFHSGATSSADPHWASCVVSSVTAWLEGGIAELSSEEDDF